ncbi:acyl carrier protein [Mycoplasmatota bacterium WC44]
MIFEKVRDIISEELSVDADTITIDTQLAEDLGADSLDAVELIMSIEDEFDCEIPDELLQSIRKVRDIVEFIEKQ